MKEVISIKTETWPDQQTAPFETVEIMAFESS
jgi:hypothetical protein